MRINIVAIVILSGLLTSLAFADENQSIPGMYELPGYEPIREYGANFDTVDLYTGNLKLLHTDLKIPLNGDLSIEIQRNYQFAQNLGDQALYGDQSDGRSIAGSGWDFHMGRIWWGSFPASNSNGCKMAEDDGLGDSRPVLELPDGSKQILQVSPNSDQAFITTNRWVGKCLPTSMNQSGDGGLIVIDPNGKQYIFNKINTGKARMGRLAYVVTRIQDRNGNGFNINYFSNPSGLEHVRLIQSIDPDEVGVDTIYFYYKDPATQQSTTDGDQARLYQIKFGSKTVTYDYNELNTNGLGYFFTLKSVTLADGAKWQYLYNLYSVNDDTAPGRLGISKIITPLGGQYEYQYAFQWIPAVSQNRRVVTLRTLKNSSNSVIGQWSYSYSAATAYAANAIDTTTVVTPISCEQYTHSSWTLDLWKTGTLQSKKIYAGASCAGTPVQSEVYTWEPDLISPDGQYQRRPVRRSIDTYAARLANIVTTRESTTYTKTLSNYDNYGNARRIVSQQAGQSAKTADYTYDIKTGPWIIHLLDTEYYGLLTSPNIDRVYDASGNLTSETSFGKTNSFLYNSGEISSHTDPDSKVTSYSSYKMGVPRSESKPESVSISRSVDGYGNVISETYNGPTAAGHSDTTTTIGYSYDDANRIKSITTPRGSNYIIGYTFGSSNTRTITRGLSTVTERFDSFGNKTEVVNEDTSAVANPKITTKFVYDAVNRLKDEYYPSFGASTERSKSYTYDVLNRVKTISNIADGSSITYNYLADNKVVVTDEASKVTTYSYRSFDNPDEKQLMKIEAPESQTTTINRKIIGLIDYVQQGTIRHDYGYDNKMLLTSETRPEFGTITYARDNRGNMTSRKVGAAITSFSYDGLSRLISIDYPNSTPDVSRIWYNKFGKPWQINRGDSTWDYTYDASNNLTNEKLTLGGSLNKTFVIDRTYDSLDQESSITYPTGKIYSDPRDALGRIKNITQADGVGTLVDGVKYRASGNYEQYNFGNGRVTTVTETARRWPAQFTVSGASGPNFAYDYFSTGDVKNITDYVSSSRTRSFTYDGLHRLKTVAGSGAWGNADFGYSVTGNIQTKTIGGNLTTINYDGTNRVSSVANNSGTVTYSYDNYGNVSGKGNQLFFFDDASNLIWDGTTATPPNFAYDGHNRRYWQIDAAGNETISVYSLNGKLMYQEGKQDRTIRDYIYLDNTLVTRMDYCDTARDTDGDGVPDCTETTAGTNPEVADANQDKDGDGLTNLREYQLGTSINNPDSDGDGMPDGYEVNNGLNARSSDDAHSDILDMDGLDNYAEYLAGTDPRKADSDNDGIPDGQDPLPMFNVAVLIPIINLLLN